MNAYIKIYVLFPGKTSHPRSTCFRQEKGAIRRCIRIDSQAYPKRYESKRLNESCGAFLQQPLRGDGTLASCPETDHTEIGRGVSRHHHLRCGRDGGVTGEGVGRGDRDLI